MGEMNTMEKIMEIVERCVGEMNLDSNTDLIESGYMQSLAMMNIILELEETFGFETEAADLVRANFRSVSTIESLVRKYIER